MAVPVAVIFPFLDDYNGSSGNEDDKDWDNDHNDGDDDDDNKRDNQDNSKFTPPTATTGKTRTVWSLPGSTLLVVAMVTWPLTSWFPVGPVS